MTQTAKKERFMKPAEGGIVRWPDGRPVNDVGEMLPMNSHFLYYVKQKSLVDADEKLNELMVALDSATLAQSRAKELLANSSAKEDADPAAIEAASKEVTDANALVEKASKALSDYEKKAEPAKAK